MSREINPTTFAEARQAMRDKTVKIKRVYCGRCETMRLTEELNIEGCIHHDKQYPECLDRKACERRKRKTNNGRR